MSRYFWIITKDHIGAGQTKVCPAPSVAYHQTKTRQISVSTMTMGNCTMKERSMETTMASNRSTISECRVPGVPGPVPNKVMVKVFAALSLAEKGGEE